MMSAPVVWLWRRGATGSSRVLSISAHAVQRNEGPAVTTAERPHQGGEPLPRLLTDP